jgi:hypothetical protein
MTILTTLPIPSHLLGTHLSETIDNYRLNSVWHLTLFSAAQPTHIAARATGKRQTGTSLPEREKCMSWVFTGRCISNR